MFVNFFICTLLSATRTTESGWAAIKKADVKPARLLDVRKKFVQHAMVSAGMGFGGKGQLQFVDESAKVHSAFYVGCLLPSLVDDCTRLLPSGYIFQQDGTPSQTAHATQNWLQTNCPDFIAKDQWTPNSPDLNPLDYHVWGQCCKPITSTIQNRK